jgi:hypothetical protein
MGDVLLDIPTVEYTSFAAMQASYNAGWFKKRYVFIKDNELLGGGWSFHLFTNITDGLTGEQTNKLLMLAAEKGNVATSGIPAGGAEGQALVKNSDADYDVTWRTIEIAQPAQYLLLKPGTRLLLGPGKLLKL